MKRYKNQYFTNESASKFHNRIRELFATEAPFSSLTCLQEVNVKDLVPDYSYHNHNFDWFIKELDVVIELHGIQHYKPINFGGESAARTIQSFRNTKYRDSLKQAAAEEAGYQYIEIPYSFLPKITAASILELIEANQNDLSNRPGH